MKTIILNLTQHAATPEQVAAGVVDLVGRERDFLIEKLTFDEMPTRDEIREAADSLAELADSWLADNCYDSKSESFNAMIDGPSWLMSALEKALKETFIQPLYAFSKRESVEEMHADGSVKKSMIFKHLGFLEA